MVGAAMNHKLFYTSEERIGKRLENGANETVDTELPMS